MPVALGILAAMVPAPPSPSLPLTLHPAQVRNVRLVLCTLINLGVAMLSAILIMYPIGKARQRVPFMLIRRGSGADIQRPS